MKYLGVELDTRLSFATHIATVPRKATESVKAIGRLMPNVGGPAQAKRALLGSVTNSKLLYAFPTWATVGIKTAKNRNEMARTQRTTALRTITANLLAHERARVKTRQEDEGELLTTAIIRKEEKAISISSWQSRWDRSAAGPHAVGRRWTHRLLPEIARWLAKPAMSLTYRLTQALSAHGCYRSYLRRFNQADDSYCTYCMDPDDTAEHTLFACPRWEEERAVLARTLRRSPEPGDVQEILCGPRCDEIPENPEIRRRLETQMATNRQALVDMV